MYSRRISLVAVLCCILVIRTRSEACSGLQEVFRLTAGYNPCVWQACPSPPSPSGVACSDLVAAYKKLGEQEQCIFNACPADASDGSHEEDGGGQNEIEGADPSEATPNSNDPMVGIYLPNWFVYRKHYMGVDNMNNEGAFVGDPTDTSALYFATDLRDKAPYLTHIYYAFYNLNADCRVVDADPDASWYGKSQNSVPTWIITPMDYCPGLINQMMSLKTEFPHLKIMISVGGWTYSENFYHCAESAGTRELIYRSFDFYAKAMDSNWGKANGLIDGVDFDWEHPSTPDGLNTTAYDDNDWNNYASLVSEFRQLANQDGRTNVHMTSAIGVGNTLSRLTSEFVSAAKTFCESLDYVNLMTYDMHGKWDPTTGHNAPFCTDPSATNAKPDPSLGWSVVQVSKLLGDVCGYSKITLGMPNYAPAWTGIEDNNVHGLYQTSTQKDGVFARWSTYSEDDTTLVSQGQVHYWDMAKILAEHKDEFRVYTAYTCKDLGITVPVQYVYSQTRKAFASFETLDVIKAKVQWAKQRGFAGFFFWDASQDRYGETLKTAFDAWGGVTPKPSSGSKGKCYDNNKPNFSVDPITNKPYVDGCHTTGQSIVVNAGDGCAATGKRAKATCPSGTAFAVGGVHQGMPQCVQVCDYDWSSGEAMLWASDTVYYVCDLSEVNGDSSNDGGGYDGDDDDQGYDDSNGNNGNHGSNGNHGNGNHGNGNHGSNQGNDVVDNSKGLCYGCSECVHQSNTSWDNAACSKCRFGGNKVNWPCNDLTYPCICKSGSEAPNPSDCVSQPCKSCKGYDSINDDQCASCGPSMANQWPCPSSYSMCYCAA